MAANEDSFKHEYGADFPMALDALSMGLQNRTLGHNFSPAELIQQLNVAAEYKERTARRAGKGKRLEASKFEKEMETESRKGAQAACLRLILPKTKDEIPDVFLRRLDAHRTATEALIIPQTPPETNTDCIKRFVAVKANTEPNVVILPRGEQEIESEFENRMNVAKACPNMVFPRGKSETADQFKTRMAAQAKSKQSIFPKAVDESDRGFKKRCENQFVCSFPIHPFDPKRENEEDYFEIRLKAHRELPMEPIEPGNLDILKSFAAERKKEAAYEIDPDAINKKLEAEKLKKEEAAAAEIEARDRAESAAEREERERVNKEAEEAAANAPAGETEREEADRKAKELMVRRKADADAKAAADLEMANKKQSFDEETINFSNIGFMPLKKLLMERGVPKDAVFSCANKIALKAVAEKHECKIVFVD